MITAPLLGRLAAMPANVAILDSAGRIAWTSSRWRAFARDNGWDDPGAGMGVDYVALAKTATGRFSAGAIQAADLVEEVVLRERSTGQLEYACDAPGRPRMFYLVAVANPAGEGTVVLHIQTADRRIDYLAGATERILTSLTLMCAWCGRQFDDMTLEWFDPNQPVEPADPADLSHGICDRCVPDLERSLTWVV
jgi:hypothetical protein